jgi:RNA polymerase sigma-70 factor (ECF subfamily)
VEDSGLAGGDENELVRRILGGSEKDFRKLVERYQGIVYAVVLGTAANGAEVEDIVQEEFMKIYTGLRGFRGESKLSTWIYRIAKNESLNAAARRKADHRPIEEIEPIASSAGNPEETLGEKRSRETTRRLISRLEERYRIAIELRYMAEKSYTEIAEIMGIPVGTVKTYIHRAKISLKRMLTAESAGNRERRYGIR